ncbi:MAG: FtsW/RodA/SpoVE family cell cycle protein [Bacteroidaceae bacterium]|jgi:cell division protein FtsW|nr:FtsW/RodA/SpoVE family cell cycle protein [Bacteroidaceae bacterium]
MGKFISDFFHGNLFKGDKCVWMIYFFLCMISLVEVYSASSRMTFDSESHWGPLISQAGFLLLGLVLILFIHRIPCKWFMLVPFILFPVAVLLLLIAIMGLGGGSLNDTNRWIHIYGISFQPSEVAKAALIMSAAVVLAKTQAEKVVKRGGKERIFVGAMKGKRYMAFAVVGTMACIVCGLIFVDNVSTAAMLFFVIVLMMFIAHVPMDLMLKGALGFALVGAMAFVLLLAFPSLPFGKRVETVKARLERRIHKSDTDDKKDSFKHLFEDKNSQTTYASIAVANSNIVGMGPGNSIQRDFLQHAESDFIFAIIIEELGIGGAIFVLFLYLSLLIRCGRIAQKCRRFFPAYLVLGFGIMMVLQALTNMGVAVGLLPVTGQTLPLISKGGTSILITSCYIGVILSVSRYAEESQYYNSEVQPSTVQGETKEYLTDGTMA